MAEFHPLPSIHDKIPATWQEMNQKAEKRAKEAQCADLPSIDHLSIQDFQHIYEPSDDTYLLIDALKYEVDNNQLPEQNPLVCLEIGAGSGVATASLRQQFQRKYHHNPHRTIMNFVTDVNPRALQATLQTTRLTSTQTPSIEAIQCDLISPLLPRFQCDVLIFNPPYVPSDDTEVGSHSIEAAWAGGKDGRCVIDRAVPQMASVLQHVGYLVTVDDNRPHELAQLLKSHGIHMEPLFRRRAYNESLTIQKLTRIQGSS